MVDHERLLALLDRLSEVTAELRRLRGIDRTQLREDVDRMYALKYLFVLAAEVTIDAGQHVIASERLSPPATFAGVFEELGRREWLPEDLASSLAAMARFRNLLVHGYADVDDDRVIMTLHGDALDDLDRFRRALASKSAEA